MSGKLDKIQCLRLGPDTESYLRRGLRTMIALAVLGLVLYCLILASVLHLSSFKWIGRYRKRRELERFIRKMKKGGYSEDEMAELASELQSVLRSSGIRIHDDDSSRSS